MKKKHEFKIDEVVGLVTDGQICKGYIADIKKTIFGTQYRVTYKTDIYSNEKLIRTENRITWVFRKNLVEAIQPNENKSKKQNKG